MLNQNEKVLSLYQEKIENGSIPTLRGHILNDEDLISRDQILKLMTTWELELDQDDFETTSELLNPLVEDGLITLDGRQIKVKEDGKAFIRNICMAFDKRMQAKKPLERIFSQSM